MSGPRLAWTGLRAGLASVLATCVLGATPASHAPQSTTQSTTTTQSGAGQSSAAQTSASAESTPPARIQIGRPPLVVQITSPLGRTGISGAVRIVARIQCDPKTLLSPVQFFVDGKIVGEDKDGPPYAVLWVDENPFEAREIVVQVGDSFGETAKDTVTLKPMEITETTSVSSVLLEPLVLDAKGRPVNGLAVKDFRLAEDDAPQTIEMAETQTVPATYTLLVDSSSSMSRRMDFVREAARELPTHLRKDDQVVVAPFSKVLGAITGPTKDRDTIAGAIDAIDATGGTAILDCLSSLAAQLQKAQGRQIVVLITDGYDENSTIDFESALDAIKKSGATVYVVAIGGVAGISLKGEDLLKRLANEAGGRAFFPAREFQLTDVHGLIAADVQDQYLLTYTPTNQKLDGTYRTIHLTTTDPTYTVKVRAGYRAPAPPPIRPQLELTIHDANQEYLDVDPTDLTVVEDGVEQKVEGFEEALAPVSVMLLLDASGSMKKAAEDVKNAARSFIHALPKDDSLGVLQFADTSNLVQDLSKARVLTEMALDHYEASGGTALYDALIDGLARLGNVEGRRAVVVLTDGRDENNPGTAPGSVHTFDEVVKSTTNVDATVFGIGLGPNVDHKALDTLAQVSGGEAYYPQDVSTLDAMYRRVLENLRRRYVISYTSTNSTHDGKWRAVVIKSKRAGLTIESKGGYFAPK